MNTKLQFCTYRGSLWGKIGRLMKVIHLGSVPKLINSLVKQTRDYDDINYCFIYLEIILSCILHCIIQKVKHSQ